MRVAEKKAWAHEVTQRLRLEYPDAECALGIPPSSTKRLKFTVPSRTSVTRNFVSCAAAELTSARISGMLSGEDAINSMRIPAWKGANAARPRDSST